MGFPLFLGNGFGTRDVRPFPSKLGLLQHFANSGLVGLAEMLKMSEGPLPYKKMSEPARQTRMQMRHLGCKAGGVDLDVRTSLRRQLRSKFQ